MSARPANRSGAWEGAAGEAMTQVSSPAPKGDLLSRRAWRSSGFRARFPRSAPKESRPADRVGAC